MRELRIGTWLMAVAAVAAWGCDGGGGGTDAGRTDGGGVVDSGSRSDSGPARDGGPSDAGGGGRCGPSEGECDISDPDACGSGRACVLQGGTVDGWSTLCITAGAGQDGARCTPGMQGECAEGFGCSEESAGAFCRAWCCNASDCPVVGQSCGLFGAAGPSGREVGLCYLPDNCTLPPPQSGCSGGRACNANGAGETVCDPAGTATEGEACMFRNSCVAGFACISGFCRQYCDLAAVACPEARSCVGLTGAPEGIGVCVPM